MSDLPGHIAGYGPVRPWTGTLLPMTPPQPPRAAAAAVEAASLAAALEGSGLRSGGTISFHHHLRNGDAVMRMLLADCLARGIGDLHLAASSLFPVHGALIPFLASGTVTKITTSYMTGPLADAVRAGALPNPVRLQTHGGRARAIEAHEMPIDLAVIAAPAVDSTGNLTGAHGPSACGPLGYAMPDADHAAHVLAVTDHRQNDLKRICIPAARVDQIVQVPSIGDAAQIVSGTTGTPPSARGKAIADLTVALIAATEQFRDGFCYQAGAGSTSLAIAHGLAPLMAERGITGDFAAGGVTGSLVDLLHAGLFRRLMDVQCFDLTAVASYRDDADHHAMSAGQYASPARPNVADRLSVMILGAAQVDTRFNVNVTTASDGRIIGGSGGHADTAAGADLAIVVTPLTAGPHPKIVARVDCLTTPGATIDAVVTDAGIAVNPARPDLARALRRAGLPVHTIDALATQAAAQAHPARSRKPEGRIVAVSEYRDGSVTDVIRAP